MRDAALVLGITALGGYLIMNKTALAMPSGPLTLENVRALSQSTVRAYGFDIDWKMLPRIADYRPEFSRPCVSIMHLLGGLSFDSHGCLAEV